MQMPSRQEIRVRNLFNVVDCKLHWQRNGDYLCVKVDRTPKGTQVHKWSGGKHKETARFLKTPILNVFLKKSLSGCGHQLWNLPHEREAGSCWRGGDERCETNRATAEKLNLSKRFYLSDLLFVSVFSESIIAFAWEPNGSKFAVLHGETPRISASFYHVKNNGKIELISELSGKRIEFLLIDSNALQTPLNVTFCPLPQRCLTSSKLTASSGAPRDSFWCWPDSGG